MLELSTMSTSLLQAVHTSLECPVCRKFFKDPTILPCSHTFCKGCLETLLVSHLNKDVFLLCPTCKRKTRVSGGNVGGLQSNIRVRSLVEVATKLKTNDHSNCNLEDKSLQRKWNKCQKHTTDDEECFCLTCNKYVCFKCGILEHAKDAHTVMEAREHETAQMNNVDELASTADAKIRDLDKYVTFVVSRRKRVLDVQEKRKHEINETFEEAVQKLRKRKTVLKNEVRHGQLGELETSLGDMKKSGRKQIDQIKKALDLVKNGLNFPLQTEALTSHKAMCQQLVELLSRIGSDVELPRRTAEEGERISFKSQGSDGLQLGQLRQKKSQWVLRTEDPLPVGSRMCAMVISPNNKMAVCCYKGGIFIYSSEGIIQDTDLKSVKVCAIHFMPDGTYIIRDTNNRISLYTERCEKFDVTFETWDAANGTFGGLTVGRDGLIFIGYEECEKIQVFKPEGGKAIREISCNGFEITQIFAMTCSQAIVVKSSCNKVLVINDVSGAIIHSIRTDDEDAYPAVCQDNSVIIAWVQEHQRILRIVRYTKELKYINSILTDFEIISPYYNSFLQEFKTGEIAFCTLERIYIFHETWE